MAAGDLRSRLTLRSIDMTTMVKEKQEGREQFLADLERIDDVEAPEWMKSLRAAGAIAFRNTPFPHYKDEAWRFTNIAPIVRTPFRSVMGKPAWAISKEDVDSHLYNAPAWDQLVFVDGLWNESLSQIAEGGAAGDLTGLASSIANCEGVIEKHLGKISSPGNAFTSLNAAFLQDGALVRIPKGRKREAPIHILHISTGESEVASNPRNLIVLEESSEATIVETYVGVGSDAPHLTNGVTEVVVGDNAYLHHIKVVEESGPSYHMCTTQVRQGRDSRYDSYVITLSGRIVRNELRIALDGEGAECALKGLYLSEGDRLIDNHLFVEHCKPHCRSRMGYKGILADESHAVFTGKVLVPSNAQHTDSDQLNNNLLLSDKATLDTMPQLEIFADEVKCTHGATIGSFPDELIFYFQSRGMDPKLARGILTYGFASDIVHTIPVEEVRDRLNEYVFAKYNPE